MKFFERVTESDAAMVANVVNGRLLPLMVRHGFPVQGLRFQWNNAASYTPAEQREMNACSWSITKFHRNISRINTVCRFPGHAKRKHSRTVFSTKPRP